ncbi:hypothetical protein [Thiomicrorhabdus lithotrophica]|uniref:Uncharacterized protein n=1 Tax=Thiomicrorhabdus lithotrophica TaxID=2949997 RepID=A0ABY8CCQ4_9GAMM|nr:hypothetical protein [Thiomicrorhabdus lithotrophica]WEJ62326.1 hypothetical protein NR989_09935 [Thiomicrorhabdus lithotrophica]
MFCYTLSSPVQQAEQINGFWLVSFSLSTPLTLEKTLGRTFYFQEVPEILLCLFQDTSNRSTHSYQFLVQQALPENIITQLTAICCESNQNLTLPNSDTPTLILADNLFMANTFAFAKYQISQTSNSITNSILASDNAFPFIVKPARYLMPEMPPEAIGASTLLEDWKVQNRLASHAGLPGCFDGDLFEIFNYWLNSIEDDIKTNNIEQNWQVIVFAESAIQKKCLQASQQFSWVNLTGILAN